MSEKVMTEEEIEQACIDSALNMGPAENAWDPDYGQIIKDGQLTDAGIALLSGWQKSEERE